LILDTGPLVAALDRDDQDHQRCAGLLATAPGPLRVPALDRGVGERAALG